MLTVPNPASRVVPSTAVRVGSEVESSKNGVWCDRLGAPAATCATQGPGSSVTKRARMEADLLYHWTISTLFALSRQASVSALVTWAGGQEQRSRNRAEPG
jgi:hypothetical protein